MKWISVDDDLPACDVEVLTWDGCDRDIDYCDVEVDYGTKFFANDPDKTITHWHQIPQPPKEID